MKQMSDTLCAIIRKGDMVLLTRYKNSKIVWCCPQIKANGDPSSSVLQQGIKNSLNLDIPQCDVLYSHKNPSGKESLFFKVDNFSGELKPSPNISETRWFDIKSLGRLFIKIDHKLAILLNSSP